MNRMKPLVNATAHGLNDIVLELNAFRYALGQIGEIDSKKLDAVIQ
jgi:hypothetical protein